MIELTSAYRSSKKEKFLLNPLHIIYVCRYLPDLRNENYIDTNSIVEYTGASENQLAYVTETYEQIKEMLK